MTVFLDAAINNVFESLVEQFYGSDTSTARNLSPFAWPSKVHLFFFIRIIILLLSLLFRARIRLDFNLRIFLFTFCFIFRKFFFLNILVKRLTFQNDWCIQLLFIQIFTEESRYADDTALSYIMHWLVSLTISHHCIDFSKTHDSCILFLFN